MKQFLKRLLLFLSFGGIPLIAMLIIYIILDPFKVIYSYNSFYNKSDKAWVGTNKDYISTKTFLNNYKTTNYNTFIFGNSRSIYYEINDWKNHLNTNAMGFHFDASNETLYGIDKKLNLIDSKNIPIDNVLLIFDYSTLKNYKPLPGHLFVPTPELVNNKNILEFHAATFKAFLVPKFLYGYLDFIISGKIKPYMIKEGLLENRPIVYDKITNEERYEHFEKLILEEKYFTPKRMLEFYERDSTVKYSKKSIYSSQKELLLNMKAFFIKHNTNLKVVISPLYNQKKLNKNDLNILQEIFGKSSVFDFSGINVFTQDYHNYYESSHYRPHIAKAIMDSIYSSK